MHTIYAFFNLNLSFELECEKKYFENMGSGCGSVGRAVTANTRDPQFESSHRQIFIRTKRSERAKRDHSVLREVEKMGYKNFSPVPV